MSSLLSARTIRKVFRQVLGALKHCEGEVMQTNRLPLVLLMLIVSACDAPLAVDDGSGKTAQTTDIASVEGSLVRGIANAMAYHDVRASVIELMRRSPIVEHKIMLRTAFESNNRSSALLRRTSEALGITRDSTLQLLAYMGPLEFYGENSADRRKWTADAYPVVILYSEDNETALEFHADGHTSQFNGRRDNVMEMVIAPVESYTYRIGRPAEYRPGAVIEDVNDGGAGLYVEVRDEIGRVLVSVDVGRQNMHPDDLPAYIQRELHNAGRDDLVKAADLAGSERRTLGLSVSEIGSVQAATSTYAASSTYLVQFANDRITDGVGSAEIELKTWRRKATSGVCCEIKKRWEGVGTFHKLVADPNYGPPCGGDSGCINGPLLYHSGWYPGLDPTYVRLSTELYETDFGGDDTYGIRFWHASQNALFQGYQGILHGGNSNCTFDPSLPCAEARFAWF